MKKTLLAQIAPILPVGVHFDEVWVEAGGGSELSPLYPEEEASVARAVEKRRREFRAGRHVARRAIELSGGPRCPLLRGTHGAPGFPAGYHGSITHTGRVHTYAAAVATAAPCLLGLDAELQDELGPELARRVATQVEFDEAARVSAQPGLLVFAAKEAVYKCVYPLCARVLGFDEVRLERSSADQLELKVLALTDMPSVRVRWFRDQDITLCLAVLPRERSGVLVQV